MREYVLKICVLNLDEILHDIKSLLVMQVLLLDKGGLG